MNEINIARQAPKNPATLFKRLVYMVALFWIALFLSVLFIKMLPLELLRLGDLSTEDVDFTDIAYQVNQASPKATDVVLINIGSIKEPLRPTIVRLLKTLNHYQSKSIGLDIYFPDGKDTDTETDDQLDSLFHLKNIVFGISKENDSYFPKDKSSLVNPGYINFTHTAGKAERTYYRYETVDYNRQDTIFESLACKMFHLGYNRPDKENDGNIFLIKYYGSEKGYYNALGSAAVADSNDFPAFEAGDVLNDTLKDIVQNRIKGKNIIIGYLGAPEMDAIGDLIDKHVVPVNPALINRSVTMPGAVVHANVLQMLIHNERIKEMKPVWFYTIAVILSFIIMAIFHRIEHIDHKVYKFLADFFFTNLVVICLIAAGVFAFNRSLHFSVAMLLGGFAFMAWIKTHCIHLCEYGNSFKFKIKKWKRN